MKNVMIHKQKNELAIDAVVRETGGEVSNGFVRINGEVAPLSADAIDYIEYDRRANAPLAKAVDFPLL